MKITPADILAAKGKRPIVALTAYDYCFAQLLDEAGVDIILVGDSLGMVIQGKKDTLGVTMEQMLYHTRAVCAGVNRALVVADMPFLAYKVSIKDSVYNAGYLIKEGAGAVKVEGGSEVVATIKAMTRAGIPVMGHIGLQPQAIHQIGGYKVQARTKEQQESLLKQLDELISAGIFAVVVECVVYDFAKILTQHSVVPTIGIGAGPYCDGQILVLHDMLGFYERTARFVRRFAQLRQQIMQALTQYIKEVKEGTFPTLEESYAPDT